MAGNMVFHLGHSHLRTFAFRAKIISVNVKERSCIRLRRKSAKTQQRKGKSAKTQYDYRSFTFALSFIIGIMQMQSMSYLTCLRLPNALECYWYACASVAVPLSLLLTGLFDIFFNQCC